MLLGDLVPLGLRVDQFLLLSQPWWFRDWLYNNGVGHFVLARYTYISHLILPSPGGGWLEGVGAQGSIHFVVSMSFCEQPNPLPCPISPG